MDLGELADRLGQAADRVGPEVEDVVHRQARLLRALIMENASGRPGPNVIEDQYRPSWKAEPFPVPDGGGSEVGTRKPQGRRLEFGFYDMTDSIGRHYFQPPFPHVEPAVNELSSQYEQAFRSALDDIFGSG
jgi:hypothetical protein